MKSGSMFKDVAKFVDPTYMEKHQQITILTANRELKLKPVHCYAGKTDGFYRQVLKTHGLIVQEHHLPADQMPKKTGMAVRQLPNQCLVAGCPNQWNGYLLPLQQGLC